MAGNLDVETIMNVVLLLPRPVALSGISINPELINFNWCVLFDKNVSTS